MQKLAMTNDEIDAAGAAAVKALENKLGITTQEIAAAGQAVKAMQKPPAAKLQPQALQPANFKIGVINGNIMLGFEQPVRALGLTPDQALAMAASLRKQANRVKAELFEQKNKERRHGRKKQN